MTDEPLGVEEEADAEDLADLILREGRERFADRARRQEIPGTVLMQLLRDIYRLKEQEARNRVEVPDEPTPLSEILEQAGLPAERKRELVRAEILRVSAELDRLREMDDALEKQ